MLDDYANQALSWQHVSSLNAYNEATYTTSTIYGRKEPITKLITDNKGNQVVSAARVFTESAIQPNDKIDGYFAITSEAIVDLDGTVLWYEVYLK